MAPRTCKIPYRLYLRKALNLENQTEFSYWLYHIGWVWMKSGVHKRTLRNPKYPGWVIKVYRNSNGHTKDAAFWNSTPEEIKPFWLPYWYTCRFFVIQPRVNHKGGDPRDALKIIQDRIPGCNWKYDVGANNVAYHNGAPVVFDFNYHPTKKKKYAKCSKSL